MQENSLVVCITDEIEKEAHMMGYTHYPKKDEIYVVDSVEPDPECNCGKCVIITLIEFPGDGFAGDGFREVQGPGEVNVSAIVEEAILQPLTEHL